MPGLLPAKKIDALFKVYTSPISDDISNYNSDFFYQPRDFIKEQFLNWLNLNSKKTDKKPAAFKDCETGELYQSIYARVIIRRK